MKRYNAVIIGLGRIGNLFDQEVERRREGFWTHASAYEALPNIKLVSSADKDSAKCEIFKKMRGIEHIYNDYRQMLSVHKIDIVSICVPTEHHFQVAMDVMDYDVKGIIIEKPLCFDIDQAIAIKEKALQKNVKILVMYQRRYWNAYQLIKEKILNGYVGNIEILMGYFYGDIWNLGSHFFNTLQFLGVEIDWIQGKFFKAIGAHKLYHGLLGLSHGIGSFQVSSALEHFLFNFIIIGDKGKIIIDTNAKEIIGLKLKRSNRYEGYLEYYKDFKYFFENTKNISLKNAINDLICSIEQNREPISNIDDAINDIRYILAVIDSDKLQKAIFL